MNDREKLNRLGEEWYRVPEQGNEAARLALCEEIFALAYKLFPKQSDAMGLFFEKEWHSFDPGKGDLYGFMSSRLRQRKKDMARQDFDGTRMNETDEVTGKERRVKMRHASLSSPVGEDGAATLGDTLPGGADVGGGELTIDETVLEVMTLMLDLKERLGGSAGNPVRINYFRLFFTDGVVDAIHSQGAGAFARRERDLFRAIKGTFLNYFMDSPCLCVKDILDAGLKLYGQMAEGRPMKPPGQPLPNDVYTTYLGQEEQYPVTAQAVSQQRTAYRKFMKEQLQC